MASDPCQNSTPGDVRPKAYLFSQEAPKGRKQCLQAGAVVSSSGNLLGCVGVKTTAGRWRRWQEWGHSLSERKTEWKAFQLQLPPPTGSPGPHSLRSLPLLKKHMFKDLKHTEG